jgi:putative MATE family efflux protein
VTPFRADPHDREILRLALPALGSLVAEPLYILSDTAVVGRIGTDELAGLAVASTVLLLGYSIFIFLAYGTTAAVARLLGAGEHAEAAHQAVQSLWLAVLIGVVLTALGLVFAEPLVTLLGAEGAVAVNALVYLRISLLGVPALLVMLAGTGYLRGLQDTRTPLVVAVLSGLANLVLEVVLIFGFGFGIGASALSTVVAQYGAAAVYVLWVLRAVRQHTIGLAPHWATIGGLGRVGRDLFLRTLALRGSFTISVAVAARFGPVALAAYSIAIEIWNLLALTLDAIAIAGQALVGRFLGASDVDEARAAGRRMLELGVLFGIVMGAVVAALHTVLPRLFTTDPEVVATTAGFLLAVALMQPVNAVAFTLDGLLIGAGDVGYLAVAMFVSAAVFVPAALAVLVTDAAGGWLWAALGLFMATRAVTLGVRWRNGGWAVVGATR